MLYHLHLQGRENPDCHSNYFGTNEEVQELAAINSERWHCVCGPAQPDVVQGEIDRLRSRHQSVKFDYDHSAIHGGGRFLREMNEIESDIRKLSAWLSQVTPVAAE